MWPLWALRGDVAGQVSKVAEQLHDLAPLRLMDGFGFGHQAPACCIPQAKNGASLSMALGCLECNIFQLVVSQFHARQTTAWASV